MRKFWEAVLILAVFFSVVIIFTLVGQGASILNLSGISILIILVAVSLIVLSINN